MNLDDFEPTSIKIPGSCKTENDCGGDIPVISSSCNKVPNFPKGLQPENTVLSSKEFSEVPFNRLAPKSGKYTFIIPELKYDGIYSRKLKNNTCFWSFCPNKPETYGTNNYFHVPEDNLCGRTIIEPPDCAGCPTGYPPMKCCS